MQNEATLYFQELLVNTGRKYSTEEEFKRKNLPKYLLAKQKRLLRFIFPMHTCTMPPDYENPTTMLSLKATALERLFDIEGFIALAKSSITNSTTQQELAELTKAHTKTIRKLLR